MAATSRSKGRIDILADMSRHDEERLHAAHREPSAHTPARSVAQAMLDDWASYRTRFVKVMPVEYRRALREMEKMRTLHGGGVTVP